MRRPFSGYLVGGATNAPPLLGRSLREPLRRLPFAMSGTSRPDPSRRRMGRKSRKNWALGLSVRVAGVIVGRVRLSPDDPAALCRGADVNPEWWIEPDLIPSDFEGDAAARLGTPTSASTIDEAKSRAHWDLLRGQILCYSCPLLWKCRQAGWSEPAHVWGGLQPLERFRARKLGSVPMPARRGRTAQRSDGVAVQDEARRLFLTGEQPGDIAATLGRSDELVRAYIKSMYVEARELREELEPWGATMEVPRLPSEVTKLTDLFNRGRDDSPSFLRESA